MSTLLDRHRQSLAADPEDRRAFEALQEHLFLEGDWDEFVSVCQRRLEAPSLKSDVAARVALLFRLGQVLQDRCDRLDDAAAIYTEIARLDPTYRPALRQLRAVYNRREQWDMVLQIAEMESRTAMPPHELAVFMAEMGRIWLDYLSDPGEASTCFERALDADPHQQIALAGLARARVAQGDAARAAELYERLAAILRGRERAPVLVDLGQLYAGPLAQRDRATECFRRAMTDDPRNEPAVEALIVNAAAQENWQLVADLYERRFDLAAGARHRAAIAVEAGHMAVERLRDTESARMWFERAVELCDEDMSVHFAMADLARQQNDDAALLRSLDRLAALMGKDAPAGILAEAADLHANAGRDEKALALLKRAHARHPDDALIAEALTDVMLRVGTGAELVEMLEARAASGDDAEARADSLTTLARTYEHDLDDPAAAAHALERARAIAPDRASWLVDLDRLYRRLDRKDDLRRLLEQRCASGDDAERAHALTALGNLLVTGFGDAEAAGAAYEQALEIIPDDAAALTGLARVAAESGDDDAQLRACEREARVTRDPARMRALVFTIVPILERRDQLENALVWLEGLRSQLPEDRKLLEEMARLQRRLGLGDELALTLDRLAGFIAGAELAANRSEVASLHSAAGRGEQAIAAWEAAAEASPRDVDTLTRLAEGYRGLGRFEDLARVLRKQADVLPDAEVATVLDELSRLLEDPLDDGDSAIVVLWRLVGAPHCPDDAHERLAHLLERSGRFEELAQHLVERRRRVSDDADEALQLDLRRGRLLLSRLGQVEEAAQIFRTVRSRHPGCVEATELLEQALRTGNDAGGLVILLESRARAEADPRIRCEIEFERATLLDESLGEREAAQVVYAQLADQTDAPGLASKAAVRLEQVLERRGDWAGLRDRLELGLGTSTEDADFMLHERLAALCRDRLDDAEAATEHLEAMGRLRPDSAETWRALGRLYEELGRDDDLLDAIEREIPLAEDADREGVLRGRAAELLVRRMSSDGEDAGRSAEARAAAHYERVLELDPGHSRASEFLLAHAERHDDPDRMAGLLRDRLGRLDAAAEADQRRSLRLRLAELLAERLDDASGAIETLQAGLDEPGDALQIAAPLCALYQRVGRLDDASQLCGRMADEREAREERLHWRTREAELLEESGQRREAVRAYRQVLELSPGDRGVRAALADLYRDLDDRAALAAMLRNELEHSGIERHVELRIELAGLLAKDEPHLEEALEHMKWVLDVEPHNENALLLAVDVSERLDRHEDLATILESRLAIERDPEARAALLERRGDLLAGRLGQLDGAAAAYREAVSLAPDRERARTELRRCLEQLGRWPAVLDCLHFEAGHAEGDERCAILERAVELAREHISADATLPWLERLRVERPDDPSVLSRIADVHGQGGRPEARLRALEIEVELSTDAARRRALWVECARILERDMHAPGRAIAAYEAARTCAPRDRAVLAELDRLYDMMGMPHERIQIIEILLLDATGKEVERLHQAAAELQVAAFSDPHRAVPHQLELVALAESGSPLHLERLRSLGESLRASGAIDAWTRCARAELERIEDVPSQRHRVVELRLELAEVEAGQLARPDSAIGHLRKLADLYAGVPVEPSGPLSRERRERAEIALLDGLRAAGNAAELATRLEQRAGRSELEAEARSAAWREVAHLRAERLHSPLAACQAWEAVLEIEPADLEAVRGLRCAGELLRDWPRVARGLELELAALSPGDSTGGSATSDETATNSDAHTRAALWQRLGEVRWRRIGDLDAAASAFASALAAKPDDLVSLRALERLAEEREAWTEALDLHEREVQLLGDDDPSRQREIWLHSGAIARDRVGDDGRALRAYEAAAELGDLDASDLRDLAELHAALGDKERFASVFSDWCGHPEARPLCADALRLAEVLGDLGRVHDALVWARKASELDETNAAAWRAVAEFSRRDGDDVAAGAALEREASLLAPREAANCLLEAALLAEDRHADRALERLRSALRIDPGFVNGHAVLARVAEAQSLHEEAETAAGHALDADVEAEGLNEREMLATALIGGRSALARERTESAARFFGIALSLAPEQTEALDAQSTIHFDAGDYALARPLLETRLALEDADTALCARHEAMLGRCLESEGELDEALARYRAALDLDAGDAFAHEGVARIHETRDDVDASLAALEAWLEHDDMPASRARTHLRAADHLLAAERAADAEAHLRAACKDDPRLGAAWARLVALLHDADRADDALEVANRALPHLHDSPELAAVSQLRGALLEAKGDPRGAAEAFARAAEADPRAAAAVLAQARLLRSTGDWFAADQAIGAFLERHPDASDRRLAPVHLERGRLLAGPMEDVGEALVAYEKALALDPDLEGAREPLAGLLTRIPDRWTEALEHHSVLLRSDPLKQTSLRALLEISRRRDLDVSVQFGLALLRAVGMAAPGEMAEAPDNLPVKLQVTPKLDDALFETARRICSQARDEIAQVLAELAGAGGAAAPPSSDPGFGALMQGAIDEITAPGVCALPTEALSSVVYTVTALAADPGGNCADSPYLHGLDRALGRWTRRKIRKTLGEYSVREVQSLDYDAWRSAVRVLAARIAIDRSDGDLRQALIVLAGREGTAPASNADLSALVACSSEARALVAKLVSTWCDKIRRGF